MNPILFQSKFITIHSIWLAITIAIIIFTITVLKLIEKKHLKIQFLSDNIIGLTISAIIGNRILAVLFNAKGYFYELSPKVLIKTLYFWDKGISIEGAVIGWIIYLIIIAKKDKQDIFAWLDIFTPSGILAVSVIHLGTFFEGTNHGKETTMPWGVNFESSNVKYIVPIHPTQIYSFLASIIIFYILYWISKNKKLIKSKATGIITLSGTALYSTFAVLISLERGDDPIFSILGVRIETIIYTIIAIITSIFLIKRYNKHINFILVNNQHEKSN